MGETDHDSEVVFAASGTTPTTAPTTITLRPAFPWSALFVLLAAVLAHLFSVRRERASYIRASNAKDVDELRSAYVEFFYTAEILGTAGLVLAGRKDPDEYVRRARQMYDAMHDLKRICGKLCSIERDGERLHQVYQCKEFAHAIYSMTVDKEMLASHYSFGIAEYIETVDGLRDKLHDSNVLLPIKSDGIESTAEARKRWQRKATLLMNCTSARGGSPDPVPAK